MTAAEFAINFFVALFALIDPVGNVPLFAAATDGATAAGRRLTALYISLFAFVFLSFFYLTGLSLLQFFGISMSAFRIAGGILLLLLGLDMARGDLLHSFADHGVETKPLSTRAYAAARFESLIVAFWFTSLISRVLGKIGMVIVVRVLGLILCAMAVQFMLTGLANSTIGLMRHDTATPYQQGHRSP